MCLVVFVWLGCSRSLGVGLELKGLGFIVFVFLSGIVCFSVFSLFLRGRLGGVLKGGVEMNVV